ncbi:unnamed protein product [Caenorhabditis angaria]|uniref:SAM domain-containing protein n=1 Tax=Caenorhabditis angaria TaxID=860376 RepID=A0A9P1J398_9PELO|nr:unnamed protein product [Caenorhabditis angaria]
MGDNGRPRIMQVAVFQPGAQPAQQSQPQATSSQVVPVRQMQQQTTHSQQHQFFQPIQPTPGRFVSNNGQGSSNGPPPPTLENLRLVGTAQYRQIVPNPNEPGQRLIPQYHKIVPRSGPVRYATIQPGQAPILTMNRQIQPRPQTQNNGAPTVFQAVPFTTQPNRDPIVLSKHQFERLGKPITIQFNNNDGNDKPPVLQQEEPCKQNVQTSSEQGTSGTNTHNIVKLNLAKPAKSASASDLTLPAAEPLSKPQSPKKRRTLPVEDDSLVIYPPPKPKNVTAKNFYSPEAYDLDQFLMEAVFKPEKEVLQHNFKGTTFTEYTKPQKGDVGVVTAEKIKNVSSLVGLKPVTPNKLNKKTNKRQHSNKKEDPKKEIKLSRGQEDYFEDFLAKVSAKARIAETKPSFCVKPRQKNSPKITGNSSPIALPETTTRRSPMVATRAATAAPPVEPTPPEENVEQNETENNVETSTSINNQNNVAVEEVEGTHAETSTTTVEAQVSQPATPKTPTNTATSGDKTLQKIAEECALEVAGCSLQQLPGGLPLKRLSLWTVDECQQWTQQVTNSDEYRHIFEREEIDGSVMVFVPYNELASLLNLRFGPAKKMEVALKVVKAFDAKVRDL